MEGTCNVDTYNRLSVSRISYLKSGPNRFALKVPPFAQAIGQRGPAPPWYFLLF